MAGFSFGELARSGLAARPRMGRASPYGGVGTDMYANGYGAMAPAAPKAAGWGGNPSGATPPIANQPTYGAQQSAGYGSNANGTYGVNYASGTPTTGGNMTNPKFSPSGANAAAIMAAQGFTPSAEQQAFLDQQKADADRNAAIKNTMQQAFGGQNNDAAGINAGDQWAAGWAGSSSDYAALKDAFDRYVAGGGDRFMPNDPQAMQYLALNRYFENQRRAGGFVPQWWYDATAAFGQPLRTPGPAAQPIGAPGPRGNTNY